VKDGCPHGSNGVDLSVFGSIVQETVGLWIDLEVCRVRKEPDSFCGAPVAVSLYCTGSAVQKFVASDAQCVSVEFSH
jgi:hypothetical protein